MNQAVDENNTSQIIIRVKLDNDQEPNTKIETEEYDTGKILLALGILVGFIVGAVYFFSSDEENKPVELVQQELPTTTNANPSDINPTSIAPIESTKIADETPQKASDVLRNETQAKEVSATVDKQVASSDTVTNNDTLAAARVIEIEKIEPLQKETSKPTEESITVSVTPTVSINEPVDTEITSVAIIQEPAAPEITQTIEKEEIVESTKTVSSSEEKTQIATPTSVAKNSKFVKRPTFTTGINKREPVDQLGSVIETQPKSIKKVYYFTELRNLKGEQITHRWLYNGKVQSEIKFNVGGNRWRVNSSKRISHFATGNWQVQVVNSKNEILQSDGFQLKLDLDLPAFAGAGE